MKILYFDGVPQRKPPLVFGLDRLFHSPNYDHVSGLRQESSSISHISGLQAQSAQFQSCIRSTLMVSTNASANLRVVTDHAAFIRRNQCSSSTLKFPGRQTELPPSEDRRCCRACFLLSALLQSHCNPAEPRRRVSVHVRAGRGNSQGRAKRRNSYSRVRCRPSSAKRSRFVD